MALLPSAFRANDHEKMNDFSVIPNGDYVAQIVKSEMVKCKETAKDPKGKYLKIQEKILDGEYKGKIIFAQLNLININPQAVEIANKELSTICSAVGKLLVTDSGELHGIPHIITVCTEKSTGYPDKNKIDFYAPIGKGKKPAVKVKAKEEPDAEIEAEGVGTVSDSEASGTVVDGAVKETGHAKRPWEQ